MKIARGALLGLTALALLLTILAAVYGAFRFIPTQKAQPPQISIKLQDMIAPKPAAQADAEPATTQTSPSLAKPCQDATEKLNRLNKGIGWQKRQQQSYNPQTMQVETLYSIDNDSTINQERYCQGVRRLIAQQNEKLQPYFKKLDLSETYYGNLNAFLDEISTDSSRVQALQPADEKRYSVSSSLEFYNDKFDRAVSEARDSAAEKEAENESARIKGHAALYAAAIAFGFFFSCCLILVFLRIEINTRDLVRVVQEMKTQRPEPPPIV